MRARPREKLCSYEGEKNAGSPAGLKNGRELRLAKEGPQLTSEGGGPPPEKKKKNGNLAKKIQKTVAFMKTKNREGEGGGRRT